MTTNWAELRTADELEECQVKYQRLETKLEAAIKEQQETQHELNCMATCAGELQDSNDELSLTIKRVSELPTLSWADVSLLGSCDEYVRMSRIEAALEN